MAKIKSIALTAEDRLVLENGWHRGKSPAFRQRCRIVLLKSEARTSKDVAEQVGCCEPVVNTWLARYRAHGLEGLRTQTGQGRRAILQTETDLAAVRRAVQDNRQRVSLAKAELERELGKEFSALTLRRFLKKNGCRFKRIRRRVSRAPSPDVYEFKRECLAEYERLSEMGHIDLFYGDESRVSLQPCVPYGWQFADEQVSMPSTGRGGVNCFALLARDNRCHVRLTGGSIDALWVSEQLDAFSLALRRPTVVVLDNASAHVKAVRERGEVWQGRGLFVFFLPAYSPHLNIAEALWRKLKYEWLRPEDYADKETLRLAVWQALSAVGQSLRIEFSAFRDGQDGANYF